MPTADLFLTEADVHHPERPKPLSADRLRAYILHHLLLFDRTLVGDSQFNNNRYLRQLFWPAEPGEVGVPRDLAWLVQEGYFLPVLRDDIGSLPLLRCEHARRGVSD